MRHLSGQGSPHGQLLFLAPRLPLPADTGGKIRTWFILDQLRRCFDVHLVCFSSSPGDGPWARQIEEGGVAVTLVPAPGPLSRILSLAYLRQPYSVSKYHSPRMRRLLLSLARSTRFVAVHLDHLHMAQYGECFPRMPRVLDEHNVEHCILERYAAVEPRRPLRTLLAAEAARTKRLEERMLRSVSLALAVSPEDAETIRRLTNGSTPVEIVHNGVDTNFYRPANSVPRADDLAFVGSMDWWPNEDAVLYFVREILPLIWHEVPQATFSVVGRGPSQALTRLAEADHRIVITGRVDDVRPHVERAGIFVVPMRVGGGTRLKILEAMSMERPVVSTLLGAEGIGYQDGSNIIIADRPQDFADRVVALSRDPIKGRQIGRRARELVEREYDWSVVGKRLLSAYRALLGEAAEPVKPAPGRTARPRTSPA